MKQKLNSLIDKKGFLIKLSEQLEVERETLRGYIETEKLPSKHKEIILKAIEMQLELDKETKEREVIAWELLK